MTERPCVQISGPLRIHLEGLWFHLLGKGYTPLSARSILRLMSHLSRWLDARSFRQDDLTSELIEDFFRERRQLGYTGFRTRPALDPILQYLESAEGFSIPIPPTPPPTALDELLSEYERFLAEQRALQPATIRYYRDLARRFLFEKLGSECLELNGIHADDVASFILRYSRSFSVGSTKLMVSVLRSLFRFLHLRGSTGSELAGAVPAVAGWRQSGLPKFISGQELQRLLKSCDRRTHGGRRDFAALLLLARLGLRRGEVVALELDDVHWREGEIVLHGKGHKDARLPLPTDVGKARCVYSTWAATLKFKVCLPELPSAPSAPGRFRYRRARLPGHSSCRLASDRGPSIAPHRSHADAPSRSLALRNCPSAEASEHRYNRHLCQSRPPKIARARPALARRCGMNDLRHALDSYLALRRALGFKLERAEHELRKFVGYAQSQPSAFLTTSMALAWATQSNNASPITWAKLLCIVRGFAQHLHGSDPRHEVPPQDAIPYRKNRYHPYIYSDEDVAALIQQARAIRHPLVAASYATLFGLLAVTGMRIGEALALDRADVDWNKGLLLIRNSKFNKSRQLPLHPTTLDALLKYDRLRGEFFRLPPTPSFLVSLAGTRLLQQNVNCTFLRLIQNIGLSEQRPRPRIHDMRHSFAVKTIRRWYEAGLEVEPRLPTLSTYLGHVSPSSTYWYLTATPELMSLAAKRLERTLGKLS